VLELNLLLSVLLIGDELFGLELRKLQLLDFSLILNFESYSSFILLIFKRFLLLMKQVVHLSLLDGLLILSLFLLDRDLELFGIHDSLLLLDGKLLIVQ
jgi:hypothetical protein